MCRYILAEGIVSGSIKDEMVMLNMQNGKYYHLNHVSSRICQLIKNAMYLDEICNELTSEFRIEQEECKKDVQKHLDQLLKLGIVEIIKDDPTP